MMRRLVWFGGVGLAATVVHYLCVRGLVAHGGWKPLPANVVAWLVAFMFSFAGHFLGTFRDPALKAGRALPRFFAVAAIGFASNQVLYTLFTQYTPIRYDLAVFPVSLLVAFLTYVLSRRWAFDTTEAKPSAARYTALHKALLAVHVIASFMLAGYHWNKPLGNWDIIPYAALIGAERGMSAADISRRAYADVRAYVGEDVYRPMLDDFGGADSKYRVAVATQPAALVENLRFYSVKPLYLFLSRMAYPFTGNSASAAVLVSALATALTLTAIPFFFAKPALVIAGLWIFLFTGVPQLRLVAACAFPDSLSMLFVTLTALLAFARKPIGWVAGAAILGVLSRPDAAVIIVPLLVGFSWLQRKEGRTVPLLVLAAVVFAIFVTLGKLALPYSNLFWHTFMAREAYPAAITYKLTLADYLAVIRRTHHVLLEPRPLLFFVSACLLALVPLAWRRLWGFQLLAAAAAGNMVVHYLIFPIEEFGHERMFLGSYMVLICAAAFAFEQWRASRRATPGMPLARGGASTSA